MKRQSEIACVGMAFALLISPFAAVAANVAVLRSQDGPRYKCVLEFFYSDPVVSNTNSIWKADFVTSCSYVEQSKYLDGVFRGWLSGDNAPGGGFRQKVVACFRKRSGILESEVPDDVLNALCENVKIEIKKGTDRKDFPGSIRCELSVSGDREYVVGQLARAYQETILAENERENNYRALKSMQDLWHEYSTHDRELHKLRGRLSRLKVDCEEKESLELAVAEAERAVAKFKLQCDKEIKKHCKTWGVSIVFPER